MFIMLGSLSLYRINSNIVFRTIASIKALHKHQGLLLFLVIGGGGVDKMIHKDRPSAVRKKCESLSSHPWGIDGPFY